MIEEEAVRTRLAREFKDSPVWAVVSASDGGRGSKTGLTFESATRWACALVEQNVCFEARVMLDVFTFDEDLVAKLREMNP